MLIVIEFMCRSRGKDRSPDPPENFQVAINFLSNTGADPTRKAIGPLRSDCFSREVRTALMTEKKKLS